ncbi:MAG: UDP-N-acetylmuramate--L-alanine ligase, partial [Chloroflexota bacterium]
SSLAAALRAAGARIAIGHQAANIAGADLVVRSSAVRSDNLEVQAALAAGIPVLRREQFLDQLIGRQQAVAIAGTHGKTTTTSMVAWMLTALGLEPSFVIGGVAANLGANAHAGAGPHFVIEADEYDRMFHGLHPQVAVVTNLEHDHPDCYPTGAEYYAAFEQFAAQLQPGGTLVSCADDPGAARLLAHGRAAGQRVLAYGIDAPGCELQALAAHANARGGYDFQLQRSGLSAAPVSVSLQAPGLHNVRNACAALGVAQALDLPLEPAAAALGEFYGAGRRFDVRGEPGGVLLIDDYAHHPTEIRATLQAARSRYPKRRIWAAWQPHTYSRLRALFAAFTAAFDNADQVLVTDVYAARETPPDDGFSAQAVVDALAARLGAGRVHGPLGVAAAHAWLAGALQSGDVLLVLSAGDADRVTAGLMEDLPRLSRLAGGGSDGG